MLEWNGKFVSIEPGEEEKVTHSYWINEVVANEQEHLVEAYVAWVRNRDGVISADQTDREILLVNAPSLSGHTLGAEADRWFEEAGARLEPQ